MKKTMFNKKEFVRIKDGAGNRLDCPMDDLSNPNEVSSQDLKFCKPSASAGLKAEGYFANLGFQLFEEQIHH